MSGQKTQPSADSKAVGHDDYALTRVPKDKRYSWFNVAVQRFGQLSALAQFMLAATIGLGMSFWNAILAITLGCVLLEIVTIFVGIAGMREGLSTSVLARWSGFGRKGSALVGILMMTSLLGWFAFQNEVFAAGMASILPVPQWTMALLGGIVVTFIVVYGFKFMGWVAYVTVPAFLAVCVWAVSNELSHTSLSTLVSSPPPGEHISLAAGTTIVAGGFIVGAVMTPDMTRFNRSTGDVVKQTVVGVTLGEYFVGVIGVLLAHGVKTVAEANNAELVISLLMTNVGAIGVFVLVISIVKINDWNLYPSSLGLTNALDTLFGVRVNRAHVALVLGVIGSALSAVGVTQYFVPFLMTLGVLFPPIAGIFIVDYFILRTWRKELDASRVTGKLPSYCPDWVPASLIAWFLGFAVGSPEVFGTNIAGFLATVDNPAVTLIFGIPAINALVVAMVAYYVLGKLGLNKSARPQTVTISVLDAEPTDSTAPALSESKGDDAGSPVAG